MRWRSVTGLFRSIPAGNRDRQNKGCKLHARANCNERIAKPCSSPAPGRCGNFGGISLRCRGVDPDKMPTKNHNASQRRRKARPVQVLD